MSKITGAFIPRDKPNVVRVVRDGAESVDISFFELAIASRVARDHLMKLMPAELPVDELRERDTERPPGAVGAGES